MYAEVSPTNDAGAGILNNVGGLVLDDYEYTSKSGTRLSSSATASASPTTPTRRSPAKVFQWMGPTAQSVDLGATDYATTSSSGRSSRRRR